MTTEEFDRYTRQLLCGRWCSIREIAAFTDAPLIRARRSVERLRALGGVRSRVTPAVDHLSRGPRPRVYTLVQR